MKVLGKFIGGLFIFMIGILLVRNFLGIEGEVTASSFLEGMGSIAGAVIGMVLLVLIITVIGDRW